MLDFSKNLLQEIGLLFLSRFSKKQAISMSGFMSKSAAFLEKSSFSCSFFAPDCHKINDFVNLFSTIQRVNPAIPLCRAVAGQRPSSNGRIDVSHDKNEHFFEKTDKKSAPSGISEKPKKQAKNAHNRHSKNGMSHPGCWRFVLS